MRVLGRRTWVVGLGPNGNDEKGVGRDDKWSGFRGWFLVGSSAGFATACEVGCIDISGMDTNARERTGGFVNERGQERLLTPGWG